jgi:hypothetical protein
MTVYMTSADIQSPRDRHAAFQAERWSRWDTMQKPNREAVNQFRQIAEAWSAEGRHTYAGYVFSMAIDYAWGDGDILIQCAERALHELQTAAELTESDDLDRVAALRLLIVATGMSYTDVDSSDVRVLLESLYEELGQHLLGLGNRATDPGDRAGFLVHGFELETTFDGTWRTTPRGYEIADGSLRSSDSYLSMNISSAFTLFRRAGDYQAAQTVAVMCPEAFTSYGLRGWKAAVAGLLRPDEAVERFEEAAATFAQDVHDEEAFKGTGHWSSINVDLWAKYFAARAAIAQIVREPTRAAELIRQAAAALEGTESGWSHPQARCLRILLTALIEILDNDAGEGVALAKDGLLRQGRRSGLSDEDRLALRFFDEAAEAFTLLRDDPASAMTSGRLRDALETLGRIPLIGSEVASAVEPRIGEAAFQHLLGPYRTWIHRTIESIRDERVLQSLLLRLMQAQIPLYAQIRHGPLEYGKDIVVLVEVEDQVRLQMYQVKAGDITMPIWAAVMYQLEQIFLVELEGVQLPVAPDSREGVLIFNGHLKEHVEPVVAGWITQQKNQLNRSFRIMHLDNIVTWIVDGRLINELRHALAELGIPVVI